MGERQEREGPRRRRQPDEGREDFFPRAGLLNQRDRRRREPRLGGVARVPADGSVRGGGPGKADNGAWRAAEGRELVLANHPLPARGEGGVPRQSGFSYRHELTASGELQLNK